jgi:murein DD-endopeptidase MepM/ murein hydrolase activator NlpD
VAVLSRNQVTQYALQAGFSGSALSVAVAIAQAESGFNTVARGVNSDGSVDRGLWQINSRWHSEISDSQAYSPAGAAQAAYKISSFGLNFSPWSTYTSGAYKQYLSGVVAPPISTSGAIAWLQYPITHGYYAQYDASIPDTPHNAVDLGTPFGTPIQSLVSGTVKIANYQSWGGQIFIAPDQGGPQWYVYHLDLVQVKPGQHVSLGDLIGSSGGQTSGGNHPTDPAWSTGPHTHTGWFVGYVKTVVGSRPSGPDITPYITALKNGNQAVIPAVNGGGGTPVSPLAYSGTPVTSGFVPILDQVHQTLISHEGFYGIALALDQAEQFTGYVDLASSQYDVSGIVRSIGATTQDNIPPVLIRGSLIMLGLFLLILLLLKLAEPVAQQVAPLLAAAA